MGMKPSPEWVAQFYYLAKEFVRGQELNRENPLFWDKVILNLPGEPKFDPSFPNVYKINSQTG